MGKNCVYLSDTEGIHDLRWRAALQSMGWQVDLHVCDSSAPIITGPLTAGSIRTLGQLNNPVIGLSWGWDLHAANNYQSSNWLNGLSGLVVDSVPTMEIAIDLGMNPGLIAMIPWGVNLEEFVPRFGGRTIDLPIDLSILSLRSHEPLYRIDTILDAVALLQEQGVVYSLTIGNEGSLTQALRRQVIEREIANVTFIGRVQEKDLPQLLSEHGIYVSAAETDGTSVTLLQAMAIGIPVVVSDSPGNAAWLDSSTEPSGTLFDLGNPADLALKLTEIADSRDQVNAMIRNARALVEREADWNQNIWRLDELLINVPR